ncbi:hypothetical protein [Staphylothermus hellenicus]|uniref:Uncharacterized protein n=1 Tax=Staphylothermus hellenicus (strain DSM 12710 / JCM 10830 / BK20S6-10-b1 / P8) TaxID=591019 RepID=D7DB49_STAHD|nr:hypothetical protein [Staphylothermus hellenicus]ADI31396.1 hypothetical protein Shell_0257 [Staphylothermus hellenicus DSM 12710]
MSSKILYVNASGTEIFVLENLRGKISFNEILETITSDWLYILLLRKVVSFATVFKTLTQQCRGKLCYARIYFYELKNQPIQLIFKIFDRSSTILINSDPPIEKLLKRIIANPKFGETVVFISNLGKDNIVIDTEQANDLKVARKLYMELSPIVFGRGFGRLVAMNMEKTGAGYNVILCVDKEGVSVQSTYERVNLLIKSISQCIR